MNTDDFEQKLKRQPLRQIPGDWREPILRKAQEQGSSAAKLSEVGTARCAVPVAERSARRRNESSEPCVPSESVLVRALLIAWRELIQPCRYAWSGMAALWVIFCIINAHLQLADPAGRPATSTAAASESVRSFEAQRQVLVELTGPIDLSPAEPPRPAHPKPRSEQIIQIRSC